MLGQHMVPGEPAGSGQLFEVLAIGRGAGVQTHAQCPYDSRGLLHCRLGGAGHGASFTVSGRGPGSQSGPLFRSNCSTRVRLSTIGYKPHCIQAVPWLWVGGHPPTIAYHSGCPASACNSGTEGRRSTTSPIPASIYASRSNLIAGRHPNQHPELCPDTGPCRTPPPIGHTTVASHGQGHQDCSHWRRHRSAGPPARPQTLHGKHHGHRHGCRRRRQFRQADGIHRHAPAGGLPQQHRGPQRIGRAVFNFCCNTDSETRKDWAATRSATC